MLWLSGTRGKWKHFFAFEVKWKPADYRRPLSQNKRNTSFLRTYSFRWQKLQKFSTSVWYKNRDLNEGEICVIQTSTFYIDYWNLQSLQNTKSWTNEPNTNNDNNTNTYNNTNSDNPPAQRQQ